MPALNFQSRFADAVESGEKTQTIRKLRKVPIQVGDRLYLYTGQRTNDCRKLGEGTCTDTTEVQIELSGFWLDDVRFGDPMELHIFATADGFADWLDLADWFRSAHGLPFRGVLIRWTLDGEERDA